MFVWFWILALTVFVFEVIRADETPQKWRQAGLDAHNRYREKFEAPPLKMDMPWLCEVSQQYADLLAANKTEGHNRNRNGSGENIGYWSKLIANESEAGLPVGRWYVKEVDCFDPDDRPSNTNLQAVAHFAQVVWSLTTSMCMSYSLAKVSGRSTPVVANYYPAYFSCNWCGVKFKTYPNNGTRLERNHRKGPKCQCYHEQTRGQQCGDKNEGKVGSQGGGDKNDGKVITLMSTLNLGLLYFLLIFGGWIID